MVHEVGFLVLPDKEDIVEAFHQLLPQEYIQERVAEQIKDVPGPRFHKEPVGGSLPFRTSACQSASLNESSMCQCAEQTVVILVPPIIEPQERVRKCIVAILAPQNLEVIVDVVQTMSPCKVVRRSRLSRFPGSEESC